MVSRTWWTSAVFYQVYPRSFADGNGDGLGDFAGLTARLDHLRDLGIDAIWLSPHYPSPFLDCGYDISDFTAVAPEYGTLDDFRAFLAAAHARGIRVVLDLVLNHTSDQHPWFLAARTSRTDPKRDWFVWRDGVAGGPPNDWLAIMGGSAWELDTATGQYYYHAFLPAQPDLNWRNPAVREAMFDAVRFWLDLGVDGFRLDAVGCLFEDEDLAPHGLPLTPATILEEALDRDGWGHLLRGQVNLPEVHDLMRELRAVVDAYPGGRVLIAEDDDPAYHGNGNDELDLVFNFPLLHADRLTPDHVRANQAARLAAIPPGAWPCNTLGNHDRGRVRTLFGDGANDEALARLHLALVLTLQGTPVLYYGEEIGMGDLALTDLSQLRDTKEHRTYALARERGLSHAAAFASVAARTRDRVRSPMQWTGGANAGFSRPGVETWLPVSPDAPAGINVADQETDPNSILSFARRLIAARRATPALALGGYRPVGADPGVLAFAREIPGEDGALVILNMSASMAPIPAPVAAELRAARGVVFSSTGRTAAEVAQLDPFEVLIARSR